MRGEGCNEPVLQKMGDVSTLLTLIVGAESDLAVLLR